MSLLFFRAIPSVDEAKLILSRVGNIYFLVGILEICASVIVRPAIDIMLILIVFGIMWITVGYVVKYYQSRIAAIVALLNCLYSIYFAMMNWDNDLILSISLLIRCILLLISIRGVQASYAYFRLTNNIA